MTDIVERLRRERETDYLATEAAAEIERLRTRLAIQFGMHPGGDLAKATQAEIERLRAALTELWRELAYMDGEKAHRLCGIAKRALEPKP